MGSTGTIVKIAGAICKRTEPQLLNSELGTAGLNREVQRGVVKSCKIAVTVLRGCKAYRIVSQESNNNPDIDIKCRSVNLQSLRVCLISQPLSIILNASFPNESPESW